MKQLLLTLFTLLAAGTNAQINFFIEGQQVDNSNEQYIQLSNTSIDYTFQNASGTDVEWTMNICVLVDDPNIEFTDFIWAASSDPNGGIHIPASITPTDPCQVMPSAAMIPVADMGSALLQINVNVTGTGCETHRYYLLDNGTVQDSIDVQYCAVLSLEEQANMAFELYPNPTSSTLQVRAEQMMTMYTITDIHGKVLNAREFDATQEKTIPLQQLPEGLYFVSVQFADNLSLTRRVHVVR